MFYSRLLIVPFGFDATLSTLNFWVLAEQILILYTKIVVLENYKMHLRFMSFSTMGTFSHF